VVVEGWIRVPSQAEQYTIIVFSPTKLQAMIWRGMVWEEPVATLKHFQSPHSHNKDKSVLKACKS
jgi:hypothetical protein